MIVLRNIHKTFSDTTAPVHVLRGISLSIGAGDMVAVMGASGSGKTTLMQIMGGLDIPSSGEVSIGGHRIDLLQEHEITRVRNREIGFVFQFHHLLNDFTACENIFLPGLIAHTPLKKARRRAKELLKTLGVVGRDNHYPSELSGGEKQRIALGRALFNEPTVVIADEPTGNLDRENTEKFLHLLRELNKNTGQTVVIATHDYEVARAMDYCLVLQNGILEKKDVPYENV
ncbi:ABC transporter ATP-binding protein [Chitinivibrio alkaliphilus]|uniref:ABC-type transport system involved in lipoprotein release, ATP-binding protein n=1 Tax=Chitinivibrio alkaliphilus ACht1 TaxID=1313304 RepID=U7DAX7_9BACT|nr:ABC transporter ATP-binding protein [Chitinivibrio alkaliphilus]ERP38723.1 ABC-type transport system involved in lipoprotein release, ATP-binding protein [Chitinivibrio alkaliphilus ACht1]